jgi:hypothetical protein
MEVIKNIIRLPFLLLSFLFMMPFLALQKNPRNLGEPSKVKKTFGFVLGAFLYWFIPCTIIYISYKEITGK